MKNSYRSFVSLFLRCSMVGADLNRVWSDYSEFFHPTVKAAMDAIRQVDENTVRKILNNGFFFTLQYIISSDLGFKLGIYFRSTRSQLPPGHISLRQFIRWFSKVFTTVLRVRKSFYKKDWFIYSCRFERHLLFGKVYAQYVEDFCMGNCMYNKDTLKAGSARRLNIELFKFKRWKLHILNVCQILDFWAMLLKIT